MYSTNKKNIKKLNVFIFYYRYSVEFGINESIMHGGHRRFLLAVIYKHKVRL